MIMKYTLERNMHMAIELLNLNVGPPESHPITDLHIGPFNIRLRKDYDYAYRYLAQNLRRETDMLTNEQTFHPRITGEWIVTADLEDVSEGDNLNPSLLTVSEELDNGLWDLLELLTFITGRRVTTIDMTSRYSPCFFGDPACVYSELPQAIQKAWDNREVIVSSGFKLAILAYNEALGQTSIQSKGCLFNTALNIIADRSVPRKEYLNNKERKDLVDGLKRVIVDSARLDASALSNVCRDLEGVFGRAANGAVPRLIRLLQSLDIIPAEEIPEETKRRVKWVNQLRNSITHMGEIRINGVDRPQLKSVAGLIVGQIVPAICARAIGECLGFSPFGLGSLCMNTSYLTEFFATGRWFDWDVETQDIQDWFYS